MIRKCPGCGSRNVRRSRRDISEITWQSKFLSPYRCRDCEQRFSVLSTKTHYFGGMLALAIVAGTIGWQAFAILEHRRPRPELAAPAPNTVAATTKLAEKNDPLAEYTLAQMYAQGDSVPKNDVEARMWLERAAEHGNDEAQYEMGMALREGRDVVQDYEGA